MFEAATLNEYLHDMREYGLDVTVNRPFDWPTIKAKRDAYIQRLNGIYGRNLNNSKVTPKAHYLNFCSFKVICLSNFYHVVNDSRRLRLVFLFTLKL